MAAVKLHLSKSTINVLPILGDRKRPIPCVAWNPDRPGPDTPLSIWDDEIPGFGLLVLRTGTMTFFLQDRTRDGTEFKLKLGRFGTELTAEQARGEARRLRAEVALGRDPAAERRTRRRKSRERQATPTVGELWTACLAACTARPKKPWSPATARLYGGWFDAYVLPALGRMKAHEVQASDVRRMYRGIVERVPATADQVLRAASSMFGWAVANDDYPMITVNPCAGALDRASRGPGANRRVREPRHDELGRFVVALATRDDLPSLFFAALLLTGCRKGELLPPKPKWSDFDLDGDFPVWIKPAYTVKTGELHRLPLNPEAVEVLRKAKEISPFVPFAGLNASNLRKPWSEICTIAGIEDLTPHDLRHWHASLVASSGESLLMVGGLLGHRDQRTSARYSHLIDTSLRAASAKVGQVIRLAAQR